MIWLDIIFMMLLAMVVFGFICMVIYASRIESNTEKIIKKQRADFEKAGENFNDAIENAKKLLKNK